MEPWERLAFTRGRSLRGWKSTQGEIANAWSGKEWTWEAEQEIMHMRKRVQGERMRSWEAGRDLKLGEGCGLDIEWLVALLHLRHPEAASPEPVPTHRAAMHLSVAGALSEGDASMLSRAAVFYARARNAMYLLDMESDSVLPENPEKLLRLAEWLGIESANALLAEVAEHQEAVKTVFKEVIQGL
jgi:glutamine synthetase adenylyltransferase